MKWLNLVAGALFSLSCSSPSSGVGSEADRPTAEEFEAAARMVSAAGMVVDGIHLPALDAPITTISFPQPGPIAIALFHEKDCLTCANLVADAWELKRWVTRRGGKVIGVVVASHLEIVRTYIAEQRLPFTVLVDSAGWAQRNFGLVVHPTVLIIAPNGVVISIFQRTPSVVDRRPIAQILQSIDILAEPRSNRPALGGSDRKD